MREFLPGVLTWSWFSEPHGYDFNGTLVLHEGGNLCIDPVEPSAEVLDQLAKEGVAQILITNRNHTRAANRVRERTGRAWHCTRRTRHTREARALPSTASWRSISR